MSAIVDKYAKEIREYKPIEYNGLLFYPICVSEFAQFHNAKPAYELMLSSLPPKLARMSWCNALDVMDMTANSEKIGFLNHALKIMALALRLEATVTDTDKKQAFYPIYQMRNDKTGELTSIAVGDLSSPTIFTMQQMTDVREIISAQNGYEIPNENWNPELVKAKKYLDGRNSLNIDFNIETMVASVAHNAHIRSSEIWNWSIKEFQAERDAIARTLNYQIFTQASMSGFVKFKNGNPYPSWEFDCKADLPSGFTDLAELDEGSKGLLGEASQSPF